jgi:aldehyde:ferredoxin oxidoreductase
MVHFADYFYTQPSFAYDGQPEYMPGLENGKWRYIKTLGRHFDKDKFEEFKSRFYTLQGWETSTGYPTASTLKSLGLDSVAAELAQNGKLGKG